MSGCYGISSVRESNETGSDHSDPRRRGFFAMRVAVYVPLVWPLLGGGLGAPGVTEPSAA